MSQSLVYINSRAIVDFCRQYPVNQYTDQKHLTQFGALGDLMAPVPYAESFLQAVHLYHGMVNQDQFWIVIKDDPRNLRWLTRLLPQQVDALRIKIFRNFYSSFVDSLHVWALCIENDSFDRCLLDSTDDATTKTDLSLWKGDVCTKLALMNDTRASREAFEYKQQHRGAFPQDTKIAWLKINGQTKLWGKHWYTWDYIHDVLYDIHHLPEYLERVVERNGWVWPVPKRRWILIGVKTDDIDQDKIITSW